jgi:hypothetical protein
MIKMTDQETWGIALSLTTALPAGEKYSHTCLRATHRQAAAFFRLIAPCF